MGALSWSVQFAPSGVIQDGNTEDTEDHGGHGERQGREAPGLAMGALSRIFQFDSPVLRFSSVSSVVLRVLCVSVLNDPS